MVFVYFLIGSAQVTLCNFCAYIEYITPNLLLALGHAAKMEVEKRNNNSKGRGRKCHEAWNKTL
jgi:hypothetical protein